jgi:hypothetical protein
MSRAATGARLPRFVEDEFDAFLGCGILAHRFLRLRCGECGHDALLASSSPSGAVFAGRAAHDAPVCRQGKGNPTQEKRRRTLRGMRCEVSLERHSDNANRLPRGRTYVRNGSVTDLQVISGQVVARVSGSSIYRTTITVQPVSGTRWQRICVDPRSGSCRGEIGARASAGGARRG